ncbi:MAG TPA: phosphotransferase [Pirellulales bacterium]
MTTSDVFDQGVDCHIYEGRNTVVRVILGNAKSFILKQWPLAPDGKPQSAFLTESWCYAFSERPNNLDDQKPFFPRLLFRDSPNCVLGIEFLEHSERFLSFSPTASQIPALSKLARHLSVWHSVANYREPFADSPNILPVRMPWILRHVGAGGDALTPRNSSVAGILDFIASHSDVVSRFSHLQQSRLPICSIHGDLKTENVLQLPDKHAQDLRVAILDWETACIGDPLWDLACVAESIARAAVFSSPSRLGLSCLAAFREALHQCSAASNINAFLGAYASCGTLPFEVVENCESDLAKYTGARMLQWTIEATTITEDIDPSVSLYASLACALITEAETNGLSLSRG